MQLSTQLKVLVACEFSGIVREAFARRGFNAWSVDLLPTEIRGQHYRGSVFDMVHYFGGHWEWDLIIAHPPCTRLANSGVRWLTGAPPKGKTTTDMWREFQAGVEFYLAIRGLKSRYKAIENPVMHIHAREALGAFDRHVVQPHWFGDKAFKATGWELIGGLPPLEREQWMKLPEKGTEEHKRWSKVWYESPGPDRWKNRSRSFPGMAEAMARQWGRWVCEHS